MGSNKAVVVVKVFKRFEYPKSMLHPTLFIDDAKHKARGDIQVIFNEVINNDHDVLHVEMFEMEAIEELGYKFRRAELEEDGIGGRMINVSKLAKTLTTQKMESKWGILNHEVNPDIYVFEQEVRDGRERIIRPATWYMRADIEDEYYTYYQEFLTLIRNT